MVGDHLETLEPAFPMSQQMALTHHGVTLVGGEEVQSPPSGNRGGLSLLWWPPSIPQLYPAAAASGRGKIFGDDMVTAQSWEGFAFCLPLTLLYLFILISYLIKFTISKGFVVKLCYTST